MVLLDRVFGISTEFLAKMATIGFINHQKKKDYFVAKTSHGLPRLPFLKISPAFNELAPSTQDFHESDNMNAFYQYIEEQWIHGIASTKLSVYGRNRRTNSEEEGLHSTFGTRMAQKRPSFWYFLNKLKSVAKAYHLEIIELGEGILTYRYKRQSNKRIDRYISEAEQKLEEGSYI